MFFAADILVWTRIRPNKEFLPNLNRTYDFFAEPNFCAYDLVQWWSELNSEDRLWVCKENSTQILHCKFLKQIVDIEIK